MANELSIRPDLELRRIQFASERRMLEQSWAALSRLREEFERKYAPELAEECRERERQRQTRRLAEIASAKEAILATKGPFTAKDIGAWYSGVAVRRALKLGLIEKIGKRRNANLYRLRSLGEMPLHGENG